MDWGGTNSHVDTLEKMFKETKNSAMLGLLDALEKTTERWFY